MTKTESQSIARTRTKAVAQAMTDRLAMFGGGWIAGHQMRNSTLGGSGGPGEGVPLPLALGVVGLFGMRRARSVGGGFARLGMAGLIGMGAYGAGKLGERTGEAAGNDGNLFSWSKDGGFKTE